MLRLYVSMNVSCDKISWQQGLLVWHIALHVICLVGCESLYAILIPSRGLYSNVD